MISDAKNGPPRFSSTPVPRRSNTVITPSATAAASSGTRRRTASAKVSASSETRAMRMSPRGASTKNISTCISRPSANARAASRAAGRRAMARRRYRAAEARVGKFRALPQCGALPRPTGRGRVPHRIRVKVPYKIAVGLGAAMLAAAPAAARPAPQVRVDQLGYAPGEAKVAYLLAPRALRNARFRVTNAARQTVFRGRAGKRRGGWTRGYRAVQPLDLSGLRTPGRYRVRVRRARSPRFRIAGPAALLRPRIAESVAFFRAQRDTAHRNDAHAALYADPSYDGPDSDVIRGRSLKRIGGTVDAADGWVDAGDFIKFTHTTAYATALLLIARRELGAAVAPELEPEARFGLAWLDKAWQDDGTMLLQVGIGSGNKSGTFNGDHDVWRLPQKDDGLK